MSFKAYAANVLTPGKYFMEQTDDLVRMLKNYNLNDQAQKKELTEKLIVFLEAHFDWKELARVSLGKHWSDFTDQQQLEFTESFSNILKNLCLGSVKFYKGETINFSSEKVDGIYAQVLLIFNARSGKKVNVVVDMIQADNSWKVYDISVYGISLITNYRLQFESVLERSTGIELIQKLKKKNKPLAI